MQLAVGKVGLQQENNTLRLLRFPTVATFDCFFSSKAIRGKCECFIKNNISALSDGSFLYLIYMRDFQFWHFTFKFNATGQSQEVKFTSQLSKNDLTV